MLTIAGHANKLFQDDLEHLYQSLKEMGRQVGGLCALARQAILDPQDGLVDASRERDREINALNVAIEETATLFMVKHQPFMDELRFITSALKFATSLERMGDIAKGVIKRLDRLDVPVSPATRDDLAAMAQLSEAMLSDTLELLHHYSAESAQEIWNRDDEIDELYRRVFLNLQKDMAADPDHIPDFTHIIFAAKNLERLGDHAGRLAELVYYINSGQIVTGEVRRELEARG